MVAALADIKGRIVAALVNDVVAECRVGVGALVHVGGHRALAALVLVVLPVVRLVERAPGGVDGGLVRGLLRGRGHGKFVVRGDRLVWGFYTEIFARFRKARNRKKFALNLF